LCQTGTGLGQVRVDAEWIKSPTARRIVMHWADSRPAWLWSQDGATLLWRNTAARYFNSKIKKSGLKVAPDAVPIRGQVARLIRLGTVGRSSLSRVQFLAGGKPVAETCSCTPLAMPDGTSLLLVAVDPLPADVLEIARAADDDAATRSLLPAADYLLVRGNAVVGGTAAARAAHGDEIVTGGAPGESDDVAVLKAGPDDTSLVLYLEPESEHSIGEVRHDEGIGTERAETAEDLADLPEPMLPLGLETVVEPMPPPPAPDDWVEPLPESEPNRALSSLFDRLAEDASLYTALTPADEVFDAPTPPPGPPGEPEAVEPDEVPAEPAVAVDEPAPEPPEPDMIAAVIEYADDPELEPPPPLPETRSHWLITGRGFRALEPKSPPPPATEASEPSSAVAPEPSPPEAAPAQAAGFEAVAEPSAEPPSAATVDAAPDADAAERVSRYNFEELGRILTDRVSNDAAQKQAAPSPIARPAVPEGVINLNAETLVLNRLPLAILVFRDQQVMFANRALTDLLGYDNVESLRTAGIASIFPGDEGAGAGPINRLVRRDGTPLSVTARLQSVTWQGRAALMLSASTAEPVRGHEAAVRAFAEIAAEAREDGFVVADRAGLLTHVSGHAAVLLGRSSDELVGKPLAMLTAKADMESLRQFLERPARFAETARPSVVAATEDGDADLTLFAEGQAGIVTGYFGFLNRRLRPAAAAPTSSSQDGLEPGMLGRVSRGIRRPLNTIIGFADLIRAGTPALEPARYAEYARDIRTAGLEIAVLVDELDDFSRLRDGRYAPRPADVDLGVLLEASMSRVRPQAAAARVLVRSAISEALPGVHADRASLSQALLNLLASAIDQTPVGGSVILSAQTGDEGNISIHVRDGAEQGGDIGERFVVFRDGVDTNGEQLMPVRSSVGLALTRSLLAVNACSLSVDPTAGAGTLFSLLVPAELIVKS
jgi:PAS domain S-box-containing protein